MADSEIKVTHSIEGVDEVVAAEQRIADAVRGTAESSSSSSEAIAANSADIVQSQEQIHTATVTAGDAITSSSEEGDEALHVLSKSIGIVGGEAGHTARSIIKLAKASRGASATWALLTSTGKLLISLLTDPIFLGLAAIWIGISWAISQVTEAKKKLKEVTEQMIAATRQEADEAQRLADARKGDYDTGKKKVADTERLLTGSGVARSRAYEYQKNIEDATKQSGQSIADVEDAAVTLLRQNMELPTAELMKRAAGISALIKGRGEKIEDRDLAAASRSEFMKKEVDAMQKSLLEGAAGSASQQDADEREKAIKPVTPQGVSETETSRLLVQLTEQRARLAETLKEVREQKPGFYDELGKFLRYGFDSTSYQEGQDFDIAREEQIKDLETRLQEVETLINDIGRALELNKREPKERERRPMTPDIGGPVEPRNIREEQEDEWQSRPHEGTEDPVTPDWDEIATRTIKSRRNSLSINNNFYGPYFGMPDPFHPANVTNSNRFLGNT